MTDFLNNSSDNFPQIRWLDRHMAGHSGFIAGGCFKQIFTSQRVKDIDIFFASEEDFHKATNYFDNDADYNSAYTNKKVVAYRYKPGILIELIRSIFGSPQEILDQFDFTTTKFAYFKQLVEDPFGDETMTTYRCLCHPAYFEHLTLKRLVIDNQVPFPVGTFERMFRYARYGYFPCRETKKRILEEIRSLPDLPDLSKSLYDGHDWKGV